MATRRHSCSGSAGEGQNNPRQPHDKMPNRRQAVEHPIVEQEGEDTSILEVLRDRNDQQVKLREKEERLNARVGAKGFVGMMSAGEESLGEAMLDDSQNSNGSFCIISVLRERQSGSTTEDPVVEGARLHPVRNQTGRASNRSLCVLSVPEQEHKGEKTSNDPIDVKTMSPHGNRSIFDFDVEDNSESYPPDKFDLETGEGHQGAPISPAVLRRQDAADTRRVLQANAGAYSGSFGEGYQRLQKVDNCGQTLGGKDETWSESGASDSIRPPVVVEATIMYSRGWLQMRFVVLVAFALLLLLLAIVVPVAVLPIEDPSEDLAFQEDSPLAKTVASPNHGIDLAVVPDMTNATIRAILETGSPQQVAYGWASGDANWIFYDDWRKKQRFAMACLALALYSASSNHKDYLAETHECDWFPQSVTCKGNDRVVTFLEFSVHRNTRAVVAPVPSEIAFLSHLEGIDIARIEANNIEEFLPLRVLHNFPRFKELRMSNCKATGTIPSSLGLLSSLTVLDLSNNELTGSVPKEIGQLPALKFFNVEENVALEGPLPVEFCSETHVPWYSLRTDWCKGPDECCTISS